MCGGPSPRASNGIASRCCPNDGFQLKGPDAGAGDAAARFRCVPSVSCIRQVDPSNDLLTEREFYFDEARSQRPLVV